MKKCGPGPGGCLSYPPSAICANISDPSTPKFASKQLECRRTRAKRNVYDGFEIDWLTVFFRRLKFPLRESFHRIDIKMRVHAVHQLNAVHCSIFADDLTEDHFSHHMRGAQFGRILRIDFAQRDWAREV